MYVLSDDEFNFAECLAKKARKKSANEDGFNLISEEFRKRLSERMLTKIIFL